MVWILRRGRVRFQLFAQAADNRHDVVVVVTIGFLPDGFVDLLFGKDLSLALRKEQQHIELLARQLKRAVRRGDGAFLGVDDKAVKRQPRACRLIEARIAADQREHPREQFLHLKRLGQVVVGPGTQTAHLGGAVVPGREHQDWQLAFGADLRQDFEAVHPGQHDVQDHKAVPAARQPCQPLAPGVAGVDLDALRPGAAADQLAQFEIVVDQQRAVHGIFPLFPLFSLL